MTTQAITSLGVASCEPKLLSNPPDLPNTAAPKPKRVLHTILMLVKQLVDIPDHLEVTPDTPFTDLISHDGRIGMDSATLLLFKAALERELELPGPLPIISLMRAETVTSIEAEIMKLAVSSARNISLPFSPEGNKTPLFLFPPGGGELHCWIGLVKYLPDRPIYGLRLRGLQSEEVPFGTMEEMVDCYVSEIKAIQPQGPYALLGMCFGGNIAFEVAQRLEAIDPPGSVVFVGGIDNAPLISNMSFGSLQYFIVDLLCSRRIIKPYEAGGMKLTLERSGADPSEFPPMVYAKFQSRLQSAGISQERLQSWQNVFCGTANMTKFYKPEGTVQSYVEFWAEPLSEWGITAETWEETVAVWRQFAKECAFHKVGGDHYTALTAAHVGSFQKALNEEFLRRGV